MFHLFVWSISAYFLVFVCNTLGKEYLSVVIYQTHWRLMQSWRTSTVFKDRVLVLTRCSESVKQIFVDVDKHWRNLLHDMLYVCLLKIMSLSTLIGSYPDDQCDYCTYLPSLLIYVIILLQVHKPVTENCPTWYKKCCRQNWGIKSIFQ